MPRAISRPNSEAADRTDETGDRALGQEQHANLPPRGAERAQDADLGSALGHGNRERVVDDEHPDEQREQAGDVHHHRVGGGHRLELLAASRGRIDLEARSEQRPQLVLHLRDGAAGLHADVDAIERPAAPEHLLGGVDVHDREVAAERRSTDPTIS